MNLTRLTTLLRLGCICSISFIAITNASQSQPVAKLQLQVLAPNAQDLQGFVQIRPEGLLSEGWAPKIWSPQTQTYMTLISPAAPIEDEVSVNNINSESISTLRRTLYSENGLYRLQISVELCPNPKSAAAEVEGFQRSSQSPFTRGTFEDKIDVGDESWVLSSQNGTDNVLLCRIGRIMISIVGGSSASAAQHQFSGEFPKSAVEAVAFQTILRASQQTALTGISAQSAHLAVNGHALSKNALKVAGRVYVPVQEFAKAMGLTSQWNTKTGALTLSGPKQKTVALTAGSTAASVGGVKASALTVPVLKNGGQPVMALDDLLKLTGGRVTKQTKTAMQIKG